MDVARGLTYVHECGILHRDIQCKNVYVVIDKSTVIGARLGGFYHAKDTGPSPLPLRHSYYPKDSPTSSPEIRDGRDYSMPADVFSLGIVFYEIGVWNILSEPLKKTGDDLCHPIKISQWLYETCIKMTYVDPGKRISAADAALLVDFCMK